MIRPFEQQPILFIFFFQTLKKKPSFFSIFFLHVIFIALSLSYITIETTRKKYTLKQHTLFFWTESLNLPTIVNLLKKKGTIKNTYFYENREKLILKYV